MWALFFSCPSASSLAPLHGGFVPRDWLTSRLYKGVPHGSPATPRHLLLDLKFEFWNCKTNCYKTKQAVLSEVIGKLKQQERWRADFVKKNQKFVVWRLMERSCLQNLVENFCFNSLSVTLLNHSTVNVCMKECDLLKGGHTFGLLAVKGTLIRSTCSYHSQ